MQDSCKTLAQRAGEETGGNVCRWACGFSGQESLGAIWESYCVGLARGGDVSPFISLQALLDYAWGSCGFSGIVFCVVSRVL